MRVITCTISTNCSQGVTRDAREHYQTVLDQNQGGKSGSYKLYLGNFVINGCHPQHQIASTQMLQQGTGCRLYNFKYYYISHVHVRELESPQRSTLNIYSMTNLDISSEPSSQSESESRNDTTVDAPRVQVITQ
jgi:hypothetical protein